MSQKNRIQEKKSLRGLIYREAYNRMYFRPITGEGAYKWVGGGAFSWGGAYKLGELIRGEGLVSGESLYVGGGAYKWGELIRGESGL